jgi:hypothetical protein
MEEEQVVLTVVAGSPGGTENKKADWAAIMEIASRMWRG